MSSPSNKKKKFNYDVNAVKQAHQTRPEQLITYKKLIEHVRNGVYMTDAQGFLVYVNSSFAGLFEYDMKEKVLGKNLIRELFSVPEERERFLEEIEQKGFVRDFEVTYRHRDGRMAIIALTSNFINEGQRSSSGFQGIIRDITKAKLLEQSIITERNKLEEILSFAEKISNVRNFEELSIYIVEHAAHILEAQKCSFMLYDKKKNILQIERALGLSIEVVNETRVTLGEPICGVVAEERQAVLIANIEYDKRFKRAQRPTYLTRSFMIAPIVFNDELIGVLTAADKKVNASMERPFNEIDFKILKAIVREAAGAIDIVRHFDKLNLLTVTDPLTKIYNYRQFSQSLEHEINRYHRKAGNLCIMMLDLDDFKSYNDQFGHVQGDILLRGVGRVMRDNLRSTDIVCRYAGDEFVVVLPETDIDDIKELASKVIGAIAQHPFKRKVTMSLGAAAYKEGMSQTELIQAADKALYEAKKLGKNRFFIFE